MSRRAVPPLPTLCGRPVPVERPLVMAIVNRTPDSFYDRGATFTDTAAMRRVDEVVAGGADIVDIGGDRRNTGNPHGYQEQHPNYEPSPAADLPA